MLVIGAIVLLLPTIAVLAMFLGLKHEIRARYDGCVSSLSPEARRLPGLALLIEDLKQVDRFRGVRWNLNAPYQAGALNILVPTQADAAWHERCLLPTAPADCLAAASEQLVICNAIVGRELADPRIAVGLFREELVRARRFLLLTFLGHELGHLASGSRAVRHLFPVNQRDGLQCRRPKDEAPTEEQKADSFGISVACEAIRKSRTLGPIATDAESAVNTFSDLRDALDDEYFAFDDTCGGDDSYPSMSRRKSTLGFAYAQCLYPGRELPYASVARDQATGFLTLEAWLRDRQITGFIGSARYGKGAEYNYAVAEGARRDRFIAFDSSGIDSQVVETQLQGSTLRHSTLIDWSQAGNLIDARTLPNASSQFVLTFSAPDDRTLVRVVTVTCAGDGACTAGVNSRSLPAGVEIRATGEHVLVEGSDRHIRTFTSATEYLADRAMLDLDVDFDPHSNVSLIDGTAATLIVAPAPTGNSYGFHRIGVLNRLGIRWTAFSTLLTSSSGSIGALRWKPPNILFTLEFAEGSPGQLQLWTCPLSAFQLETPQERGRVACNLYHPPREMDTEIGVANNDLESLGVAFGESQTCPEFVSIRRAGWLWLLNLNARQEDLVPGSGIVACSEKEGDVTVYRMRRIDEVWLALKPATPEMSSLTVVKQTSRPLVKSDVSVHSRIQSAR